MTTHRRHCRHKWRCGQWLLYPSELLLTQTADTRGDTITVTCLGDLQQRYCPHKKKTPDTLV